MGQVVVVGLDIAKSVFQVHGVDRDGGVVVRRRLRRSRVLPFFATVEPCRIGIEACATGHYWARELRALWHDVRLMAPSYVKPYVKRQKNDAADAEASQFECTSVKPASVHSTRNSASLVRFLVRRP